MQTLTFEQIPSFLLQLGEKITNIETRLEVTNSNQITEVEKPLGGVSAAAEFLGLEEPTIYALVQAKKIPFHKPSKKIYFYASELNEWIKSGKGKLLAELKEEAEKETLSLNKNKGA